MTETILQEAERLINGDRQGSYGPPEQSLKDIANLWGAYLGKEISPQDVANLMILLKVSRSKRGYHRDSFVDIAGYAGLTEKLAPKTAVTEWAKALGALGTCRSVAETLSHRPTTTTHSS